MTDKTYTLTHAQLQIAMRLALENVDAFYMYDAATSEVYTTLNGAIEGLAESLDFVAAQPPCACPRGVKCPYRGMPPGDADTGHCQQCGEFMPEDGTKAGETHACAACGAEYVVGEPEGEDEPQRSYVAPEDLDADDDGIVDFAEHETVTPGTCERCGDTVQDVEDAFCDYCEHVAEKERDA